MVQIVRHSTKKRSNTLLKMGLSIFLFLQIQIPQASFLETKTQPPAFGLQAKGGHVVAVNKSSALDKAVACHFRK
jgi:hypothetical protein